MKEAGKKRGKGIGRNGGQRSKRDSGKEKEREGIAGVRNGNSELQSNDEK